MYFQSSKIYGYRQHCSIKWSATIRKVSCAPSQQLRRGFNVLAKSQLRNARWVHREDLTSSTYPSLNFRHLWIRVLYSHQVSGWDLGVKNVLFSAAFKPRCLLLWLFCNKCMFVPGISPHWKAPCAPRRFWCNLSTPKKDQEPQICAIAGFFCLCHIYSWSIWNTLDLAAGCPKRYHGTRLCGSPFLKLNF